MKATETAHDQFGNAITVAPSWSATLGSITSGGSYTPHDAGTGTITATVTTAQGSTTGSATIAISTTLLMTAQATPSSTTTAAVAAGQSVVVSGVQTYQDDSAPANGQWTANIYASGVPGGTALCSASGSTTAHGIFSFAVPTQCTLAGSYTVVISGSSPGNTGQTQVTYTVNP
ncbi:MAG: hypothetical protein ACYDDF_04170 [Thermoplasmatota archaeon]